ncbi:MAG: hypothetical protein AAB414_02330 [Patescibacteria group bacterium]
MKKTKSFFLKLFISIASVPIFWGLESGFSLRNGDELLKSVIFASSLFIVMTERYKKFVLWISIILNFLMVILYLFWQINLSNLFGSIGFGMLLIFILSFIPDLMKRGFVEK